MSELFLGLDCSTQSFTGIIIDYNSRKILYQESLNYDKELPHYNTLNGAYFSDDGNIVHSDPLMWVEALELLLNKIEQKIDLKDIKCISGSGQQHGTVYLNNSFSKCVSNLDFRLSLKEQLKDVFSRKTSPIWMDSSTEKQCEEIRMNLGGKEPTIEITGSNTFERFSGPQIRKYFQDVPQKYRDTKIIHLVSSFIASLFIGKDAPIDHCDGAGMNLMNITTKEWDQQALNATAPNLKAKLPLLIPSNTIIGDISQYFVQKYGFSEKTKICAFSGDNPNSLIGVGITSKGKAAISLGTSDTFFNYMDTLFLDKTGEGHVFGAPTGDYMSLICFKNGSLAREQIKDKFNLTWDDFSEILQSTPPGNNGKLMLPYFYPEIVPLVLNPKVYRFGLEEDDMNGNVRAIVEAQFLSMRLHSRWTGEGPLQIHATGGASLNKDILQVAADIFNTDLNIFDISNSAALGAAMRAIKSYNDYNNHPIIWDDLVDSILKKSSIIRFRKSTKQIYDNMLVLYHEYERYILHGKENPEPHRLDFISKYF